MNNEKPACALCVQPIDGYGKADGKTLYHPDDKTKPDCYRLWTVYGERPQK